MKRTIRAIALVLLSFPATAYGQEEAPPVAADPAVVGQTTFDPTTGASTTLAPVAHDRLTDPIVRERTPFDKDEPAKTDVTLGLRTRFGAGIGLHGPLGAAARVSVLHGLGADVRDDATRVKAVCALPIAHCANGFLIQADAGTGGGKLSLGVGAFAQVHEESFKGTAGVAARLAVAHTWGDPIGTVPGLTYVGPEMDLSLVHVHLTLGVLFRVSGDGGAGTLFSWGVGFGS